MKLPELDQYKGEVEITGPWNDGTEPDLITFGYMGYLCEVRRQFHLAFCGYVKLPIGHPWWGEGFMDIEECETHGGLTFAGPMEDGDGSWSIGFDLAHCCDWIPYLFGRGSHVIKPGEIGMKYRTVDYAVAQVMGLVIQAIGAKA